MPKVAKEEVSEAKLSKHLPSALPDYKTVLVELPISEPFPSNFPIHIDIQLAHEVGMTLRRIARAYDRQQATLANGRRVVDATTALRKILETIADSH